LLQSKAVLNSEEAYIHVNDLHETQAWLGNIHNGNCWLLKIPNPLLKLKGICPIFLQQSFAVETY
jgi:hypothetical protein